MTGLAAANPGAPEAPETTASRLRNSSYELSQTVIIDQPAAKVFAFRSALANSPEWRRGVVSATLQSLGPIQVGSTCTEVRSAAADCTEEWILEVSDYEPESLLGIVATKGETRIQERHTFVGQGGVTRYTVSVAVTGGAVPGATYRKLLLENLLQLKWMLERVPRSRLSIPRRSFGDGPGVSST